jgi:hypothetical protein
MPIMNTSELQDARTNKYATSYGGGIGFEIYQFVMGGAAAAAVVLAFLLIDLVFGISLLAVGIAAALVTGYAMALWPNYLNTRHKDPKAYIRDEFGRRTQHTLIIDDRRTREPPALREDYVVEVREFAQLQPNIEYD